MHPHGRWFASAVWENGSWLLSGPTRVPDLDHYVSDLLTASADGGVLAGFDFPIGLPLAFGHKTGCADFSEALRLFGTGDWATFYDVAETPADITPMRPFYPAKSGPSGTQSHAQLLHGLGLTKKQTYRQCELGGPGMRTASPLFWTLGAAAVGKATICGWRDVIAPARQRGASLWPFDGDLDDLAARGGLVLAESYPGDAYGQIGLSMAGKSKTNREDRRTLAPALLHWATSHNLRLSPHLDKAIQKGFAAKHGIDNGFDAVVGLLAMIAVVEGERPPSPDLSADLRQWEGWILGRQSAAAAGSVNTADNPPLEDEPSDSAPP
ncbi:hypothetical protein [Lichenihabitans psoromatis]|uniref:hypothetical protein n=1 Tax=Lichenihabitans psoromatis TaxID=2528642 RepID=UPI0010363A71|nr:hypothetical protein [Lichenihabitans psoromatis]